MKKAFRTNSQYSQENTCIEVSFKETLSKRDSNTDVFL